jgi:hypothetical protein
LHCFHMYVAIITTYQMIWIFRSRRWDRKATGGIEIRCVEELDVDCWVITYGCISFIRYVLYIVFVWCFFFYCCDCSGYRCNNGTDVVESTSWRRRSKCPLAVASGLGVCLDTKGRGKSWYCADGRGCFTIWKANLQWVGSEHCGNSISLTQ